MVDRRYLRAGPLRPFLLETVTMTGQTHRVSVAEYAGLNRIPRPDGCQGEVTLPLEDRRVRLVLPEMVSTASYRATVDIGLTSVCFESPTPG